MVRVLAEQVVTYVCNCPPCENTIMSEYNNDWDVTNNQDYDCEIQCTNCGKEFLVCLP